MKNTFLKTIGGAAALAILALATFAQKSVNKKRKKNEK